MDVTDMLAAAGGDALGQVGIAMLKKAQSVEATSAAQLVQSLPQAPNAPGVGGKIDKIA